MPEATLWLSRPSEGETHRRLLVAAVEGLETGQRCAGDLLSQQISVLVH